GRYSDAVTYPSGGGHYTPPARPGPTSTDHAAAFSATAASSLRAFPVGATSNRTTTFRSRADDPNATVTVEGPAGPITLTQNPDGSYSADVPAPVADGDYTATVTDGTNSTDQTVAFTDTVAPAIDEFTVVANSDGTATITVRADDPNA